MKQLYTCSFLYSELKDSLEGAPVDGEMSELLRAILANDPDVFSGGGMYKKYKWKRDWCFP